MERSEPASVEQLTIELRVHGVSGTPTEETLHDPHPIQVAGDADTLFVRSALPTTPVEPGLLVESSLDAEPKVERHGRVLEAYHWGSLTAGAATRALYMALIPFLLVNVAYWAVPHATRWEDEKRERVVASTHPLIRVTRALIKLFALALSIELLLASALVFIDVYAWQYGANAEAQASPAWYGRLLTIDFFAHQIGRPVTLGALLCVGVTVFFSLSGKSRWDRQLAAAPSPDQRRVGPFAHPSFWVKRDVGQGMRQVHVAAMRAVLATLVAAVARADGGSNGSNAFLVSILTVGPARDWSWRAWWRLRVVAWWSRRTPGGVAVRHLPLWHGSCAGCATCCSRPCCSSSASSAPTGRPHGRRRCPSSAARCGASPPFRPGSRC